MRKHRELGCDDAVRCAMNHPRARLGCASSQHDVDARQRATTRPACAVRSVRMATRARAAMCDRCARSIVHHALRHEQRPACSVRARQRFFPALEVRGLSRVQGLSQADAHFACRIGRIGSAGHHAKSGIFPNFACRNVGSVDINMNGDKGLATQGKVARQMQHRNRHSSCVVQFRRAKPRCG